MVDAPRAAPGAAGDPRDGPPPSSGGHTRQPRLLSPVGSVIPQSEPVRWGILGAGRIARLGVAPALAAATGAQVVAVGARDRDRASALVPGARAYGSYAEVIEDPDVEVVYCALPNDAHITWTLAALGAGRHVLCEKPLGVSAAEVEAVFAEAGRAGRLLVEASWYRWHPRTRHAEALVAAGGLGRIRSVDAGFTFSGVPASDYRMDPAMGGGALYDVGCYALSAIGWALGWADLAVTGVEQRRSPSGVDVSTRATLTSATDPSVTAEMRASFDEPEQQWVVVHGDEATVRLSAPAFTAWHTDAATIDVEGADGERSTLPFPTCDPYRLMVEAVGVAARGGAAWVVPPAESIAVARSVDAVRVAAGQTS